MGGSCQVYDYCIMSMMFKVSTYPTLTFVLAPLAYAALQLLRTGEFAVTAFVIGVFAWKTRGYIEQEFTNSTAGYLKDKDSAGISPETIYQLKTRF